MAERDELLGYFETELAHLRRMGAEFSRRYPKVASRLELGPDQCSDPSVERMIESFAYLTARVRYNMEHNFHEIPSALLGILYPHYLNPVPSMAIARFEVDPTRGKLTSGYTIKRGTQLFAESHQGVACRFRTAYPVTLWPVEVVEAAYETRDQLDTLNIPSRYVSAVRIRIASTGADLTELGLDRLRFHLQGESGLAHTLYRMAFGECTAVAVMPQEGRRPTMLPKSALETVGFGPDDDVIPYARHALPQYRLLQEYFAFPEKFLFVDVKGLGCHGSRRWFDILLLFDRLAVPRPAVNRDTFALGCAPIVNLFRRTSEPVRLTHLASEYPLIADKRREATTEIYTVERVATTVDAAGARDDREDAATLEPYFSYNHAGVRRGNSAYWYVRRVPSERAAVHGTEMLLSVVDLAFKPTLPAAQTLYAGLLCTNRRAAGELPSGALLQLEEAAPAARIYAIAKPTRQTTPALGGETYWRLVSHLSLNYLSLSGDGGSLRALQEILRLYAYGDDPSQQMQIAGITGMECSNSVRRIGREAWRGFTSGTEITLTFDDEMYAGGSSFLMASVLNHFFALHTSINSFTQLNARSNQQERIWKSWAPMVGAQNVL